MLERKVLNTMEVMVERWDSDPSLQNVLLRTYGDIRQFSLKLPMPLRSMDSRVFLRKKVVARLDYIEYVDRLVQHDSNPMTATGQNAAGDPEEAVTRDWERMALWRIGGSPSAEALRNHHRLLTASFHQFNLQLVGNLWGNAVEGSRWSTSLATEERLREMPEHSDGWLKVWRPGTEHFWKFVLHPMSYGASLFDLKKVISMADNRHYADGKAFLSMAFREANLAMRDSGFAVAFVITEDEVNSILRSRKREVNNVD